MAATVAIEFDDGSKVIERSIGAEQLVTSTLGLINKAGTVPQTRATLFSGEGHAFNEYYDTDSVVKFIKEGNYERVGFQLPDSLLPDSPRILSAVASGLQDDNGESANTLFILGDTSYGDCCVDEVTANHLGANAIVHYGPSCLQPTSRLPVRYVFGKAPVDVKVCVEKCLSHCAANPEKISSVLVLHDVEFSHAAKSIRAEFDAQIKAKAGTLVFDGNIYVGVTRFENATAKSDVHGKIVHSIEGQFIESVANQRFTLGDDCLIYYIGTEGPRLVRLAMRYSNHPFLVFDPNDSIGAVVPAMEKAARMVQKRYFQVQKAKDASIFGILIGTLSVARYRDMLERVRLLLRRMGRKFYTFIVGKVNVAKLANHPEVDVYVLIACPQNSLLQSREFYKPVVTPFELEMALSPERVWDGAYSSNFLDLLPQKADSPTSVQNDGKVVPVNLPAEEHGGGGSDDELPYMSLVDGTLKSLRHKKEESLVSGVSSKDLMLYAEHSSLVVQDAAGYMATQRTFKGLEQRLGETAPMVAVPGLSGIAASYASEPAPSTHPPTSADTEGGITWKNAPESSSQPHSISCVRGERRDVCGCSSAPNIIAADSSVVQSDELEMAMSGLVVPLFGDISSSDDESSDSS
jgi:diphthamide biosynthesis protein 2